MNEIQRHPHPAGLPLSRAVQAGGFLFLSGQLAVDGDGFPVRSTVEARLFKGALVEIEVQAWVGTQARTA